MAKKKAKKQVDVKVRGKQLDLIDVGPKHSKELLAAGQLYLKHQQVRRAVAPKEAEQKKLILELVQKADLQRLAGGVIKFEIEGVPFKITPRDELVQVGKPKEPTE